MGYAPAAAVTGAQMQGAVTANLTKALMDRSSKLSADTAKYLYQLKSDELQRAISQGTLAQNEARLGLSAENAAWDRQIDQARVSQGWQRLAQSAANAGAKAGKDKAKAVKNTKAQILSDISQWTGKTEPTGKYEYTVYFTDPAKGVQKVPKTIIASSANEAMTQAGALVPASFVASVEVEEGNEQLGVASPAQILNRLTAQLVNQGESRAAARAWVRKFVLGPAGLTR
jgi:ATP-dependent exoDNAse (exonuclease V) beta subunit